MKRIKKVISVFVVSALLFALLPAVVVIVNATTNRTQSEAVAWANSQVGKTLDYDGVEGAQCVDLTKYYYEYLGKTVPSGNANQYYNGGNFCPAGWTYTSTPHQGDIAVWTGAPYGHVAIVTEVGSGYIIVVEQNYNYVKKVTPRRIDSYSDCNIYIHPDFSNNPIGYIDEVTGGEGEVFIRGWAFDYDEPNAALEIHVYIGGPAGDSNAERHTSIYADLPYQGVNEVFGVSGNHGFQMHIKTEKSGSQSVFIYAINKGAGQNAPITNFGQTPSFPANITPHQHSYTTVVTAPTCTERGYTTHTCSCGDSYVDAYVNALGHNYSIMSKVPSCTEAGLKVYTCRRCGYSYSEAGAQATGHNWDAGDITIAPTTTKPGIITYTCTLCGEMRMEILPALTVAKGDMDGDGEITVGDALAALRIAAKLVAASEQDMQIGDVDGDGEITVGDALAILRVAAKLVDSL